MLRIELVDDYGASPNESRIDQMIFEYYPSPVSPITWGRIKKLY